MNTENTDNEKADEDDEQLTHYRPVYSRSRNVLAAVIYWTPGRPGYYISTMDCVLDRLGPIQDMKTAEFILNTRMGSDIMWDRREPEYIIKD